MSRCSAETACSTHAARCVHTERVEPGRVLTVRWLAFRQQSCKQYKGINSGLLCAAQHRVRPERGSQVHAVRPSIGWQQPQPARGQ